MSTHHADTGFRPASGTEHPAGPGEMFTLRRGDATARVAQLAATLREYSVAGVDYVETWPESEPTPLSCGIVLMPWPNRVAGGTWRWRGEVQQLDLSEPKHGNAIHGLLRHTQYRATVVTEDSVTLSADVAPQHGWPFALATSVTYVLTEGGLTVTHEVRNTGDDDAVFGCGAHPYLRVGDVPVDDLTVTVRAGRQYLTDDALIPTGTSPLDGGLDALPKGVRVGDLHLDTGFTDLAVNDGRIVHELAAVDAGRGLRLWADPVFAYTIVFTPHNFPNDTTRGPAGQHRAIAIEPMTCPTNALNSGEGLIPLAPGQTWRASWGISPFNS